MLMEGFWKEASAAKSIDDIRLRAVALLEGLQVARQGQF